MRKVAVITDSNSGITQKQAKELGIRVMPMPFMIDGETYFEDITLTQEEFYKKLMGNVQISTSQPSLGDVIKLWEELLGDYDEIVHIPMSSGLSTACQSALSICGEYGGRVQAADNQRISVTQRQSVLDAMELARAGLSALQIKEYLEKVKFDSSIYIMINDLKYLKKGGRITPAAAAFGAVLNIKPVLQIQGERLDAFGKARGIKHARRMMIEAMRADFGNRFAGDRMQLMAAYTYNKEAALSFKSEIEEAFPGFEVYMDPLSLSVSCHIGPGALAIACSKKIDIFK